VAGRDITEGRAERAIAVDVGVVSSTSVWQNTDIAYDIAIGGLPFILATNNERPYGRRTAPFKKEQFDNTNEPGEQSLTGWWIRSQMSFHGGSGINFFDPATNDENGQYRFADSRGINVWTKGQATLLKDVVDTHETTGPIVGTDHQHPNQHVRSIQWSGINGVLLHDEYDVDKIAADGTVTHFIDYNTGSAEPVRAICDDGVFAYWVSNAIAGGANKLHMYKKALTDNTTTIPSPMFTETGLVIEYATMEFIKDRIILCVNNKVYELATTATALPSPVYTNPNTNYHYTSVAASGPAIYTAGHSGIYSTIQKYTLNTTGAMPTLTSAVVAAELPAGEIIEKIYYYLGYMMIGTSKGIRVGSVNDQDGSINYGPLIVETVQPVYDFAARDKFIWATTGIGSTDAGLIRIDLGGELEPLRFAYANDLQASQTTVHFTTGVAFLGTTNRLAFCTAYNTTNGAIYLESATNLVPTGYLTTGNIRYGTLEPKNFKRLLARGNYTFGSMTLNTVDANGNEYDHISYDSSVPPVEVTTSNPATAQEYVAYKFAMYRDGTDNTKGPVFKGYQAKATIATPRQRLISHYVYCFDEETDKNNSRTGYSGRAYDRMLTLESIEENGDIVTWQDLNTGDSRQVQIEGISLVNTTPPDKNSTGFGGILEIVVRTV
jgi:hypothetical protein